MRTSHHRISQNLLADIAEVDLGNRPGTTRRNHEDCPAGVDRRRRLYVTVKDDNTIFGYCHNCGTSGRTGLHGPRIRRRDGKGDEKKQDQIPPTIPLTPRHNAFLAAYGITDPVDVASLADEDAMVFCNGNPLDPTMNYGVVRSFEKGQPKWCKVSGIQSLGYNVGAEDALVVCEDALSAMKVAQLPRVAGTAILGTHLPIHSVGNQLITVVWLDNDSEIVIQAAHKIAKSLALQGREVVLVLGVSDPKKYSTEFIHKVVYDSIKLCSTAKAADQSYHVLEVQPPHQGVRP